MGIVALLTAIAVAIVLFAIFIAVTVVRREIVRATIETARAIALGQERIVTAELQQSKAECERHRQEILEIVSNLNALIEMVRCYYPNADDLLESPISKIETVSNELALRH
jgi:hypothetical protein